MLPSAYATSYDSPTPYTVEITITDPETGEAVTAQIDSSHISTVSTRSTTDSKIAISEVRLGDVPQFSDILQKQSGTKYADIILTAGMEYCIDKYQGTTILSIKRIFGSYEATTNFSSTNKKVYYGSSGHATEGLIAYPTGPSFSYNVDDSWFTFYPSHPPYIISECTCKASGMGGELDISYTFTLSDP